jgi:hypothetical protein
MDESEDVAGEQAGERVASADMAAAARTADPEQLADKVYRLMLEEIRLAQARGERVSSLGKR